MSDRCEFCDAAAQWRFTEVVGGKRHTVPVCAQCARERGIVGAQPAPGAGAAEPGPAPAPPAAGPVVSIEFGVSAAPSLPGLPTAPRRCTECGTTLVAIRKTGRVGCAHCYQTFRQHLEPLLRRVHGSLTHHGHRPDGDHGPGDPTPQGPALESLREELRRAIEAEDFENAARLRDAIARQRTAAPKDRS